MWNLNQNLEFCTGFVKPFLISELYLSSKDVSAFMGRTICENGGVLIVVGHRISTNRPTEESGTVVMPQFPAKASSTIVDVWFSVHKQRLWGTDFCDGTYTSDFQPTEEQVSRLAGRPSTKSCWTFQKSRTWQMRISLDFPKSLWGAIFTGFANWLQWPTEIFLWSGKSESMASQAPKP